MLLCFVDESVRDDHYVFSGVIVDALATVAVTQALDELMQRLSVSYGVPEGAELHAYEVFQGRGVWANQPPRVRVSVFQQVMSIILANDVTLLLRATHMTRFVDYQDRMRFAHRNSPEVQTLRFLLQRVQEVAGLRDTHALVIMDERADREQHRDLFAAYHQSGTPGIYMSSNLGRLLDTIHFAPSHRSRLLQAADFMAFFYGRRIAGGETNPKSAAVMDELWEDIDSSRKLHSPGIWP
ncbi:DUF3800 domain-containing protein [Clavibacter sp. Sh2141]|uniref:DUF3800 domain-containing protein n=1 Tax=Clavibacter sp. Sh2141 TaxID=3395374 RepID=UPI0039BC8B4D